MTSPFPEGDRAAGGALPAETKTTLAARLWLLALAWGVLHLTVVLLRLTGFRRTFAWLGRSVRPAVPPVAEADHRGSARMADWAVRRAVTFSPLRGALRPNCLPRSLTQWWLLRRQGVPCDLRIGVRRGPSPDSRRRVPAFAHAWVEVPGVAVDDAEYYSAFEQAITPEGPAAPG